jgi:hypothetical protein
MLPCTFEITSDDRDHQRRRGVREGVLRDRHHHEAGREELVERRAGDAALVAAEGQGEDREEQQRRDDRRHQRLLTHLDEAAHFFEIERPGAARVDEADPARGGQRMQWSGEAVFHGRGFMRPGPEGRKARRACPFAPRA